MRLAARDPSPLSIKRANSLWCVSTSLLAQRLVKESTAQHVMRNDGARVRCRVLDRAHAVDSIVVSQRLPRSRRGNGRDGQEVVRLKSRRSSAAA